MCLVVAQTLGFWKQLVSDILFRDQIQPCSIPGRRRQLPGFKAPQEAGQCHDVQPAAVPGPQSNDNSGLRAPRSVGTRQPRSDIRINVECDKRIMLCFIYCP